MSLAGITTFEQNLRTLMESEAFKQADAAEQLRIGYALLNSKYGLGSPFGGVAPLPPKCATTAERESTR